MQCVRAEGASHLPWELKVFSEPCRSVLPALQSESSRRGAGRRVSTAALAASQLPHLLLLGALLAFHLLPGLILPFGSSLRHLLPRAGASVSLLPALVLWLPLGIPQKRKGIPCEIAAGEQVSTGHQPELPTPKAPGSRVQGGWRANALLSF